MNIIRLIIIYLIIIVFISCSKIESKEKFATQTFASDNSYNFENCIYINNYDILMKIITNNIKNNFIDGSELIQNYKSNIIADIEPEYNPRDYGDIKTISLIIDPYSIYINKIPNYKPYTDGYFYYYSKTNDITSENQLIFANKNIGYVSHIDYVFIKSIIMGYRMDESNIKLIKIHPKRIINGNIDIIITNIVPLSVFNTMMEKSSYHKYGFYNINMGLVKGFLPFVNEKYIKIEENALEISVCTPYITYSVIDNINVISDKKITEHFISRFEISNDVIDESYNCYGEDNNIDIVHNKYLCNSKYDYKGELKKYYTKWDKKCVKNEECPFYKANKNYPNNHGSCINGLCEFPLGVKPTGFKTYESDPFCYNCDPKDIKCCEKQAKPDYAFANDYPERVENKLSTVIWNIT
jgi:hypothetical protein